MLAFPSLPVYLGPKLEPLIIFFATNPMPYLCPLPPIIVATVFVPHMAKDEGFPWDTPHLGTPN